MTEHNKLVRDKIPEIIRASGKTPVTHMAEAEEFDQALVNKLDEEVREFTASGSPEELADVLEVIDAICAARGMNKSDLRKLKDKKTKERGSFSKRIILDSVE